ncbi:hypothetical protein PR048_023611 [Dryococelus australis]|uniref:Uncharacterized protein n=1 Tax=Dryococelus australis TaxID=614101 RepID=A0ABQ9GUL7_9NEOP|nr:hypothetical protein PR048_023611 [Dryococelus australis]
MKFRKFQVTLEGTTQANNIMKLTRIDIYRVSVEKYRPLGPQQCRRWKEYVHNAQNCGREIATRRVTSCDEEDDDILLRRGGQPPLDTRITFSGDETLL